MGLEPGAAGLSAQTDPLSEVWRTPTLYQSWSGEFSNKYFAKRKQAANHGMEQLENWVRQDNISGRVVPPTYLPT